MSSKQTDERQQQGPAFSDSRRQIPWAWNCDPGGGGLSESSRLSHCEAPRGQAVRGRLETKFGQLVFRPAAGVHTFASPLTVAVASKSKPFGRNTPTTLLINTDLHFCGLVILA